MDGLGYSVSNANGGINIATSGAMVINADVTAPARDIQLSAGTMFTMANGIQLQSGGTNNFIVITSASGSNTLATVDAGSGNVLLQMGGTVTQTATGAITGGALQIASSGQYTLANPGNHVGTLAANLTGSGSLDYLSTTAH